MNNIIKLLLFSSVEGANPGPPENTLTQTKLTCESLQGSQKDTCSGLSSKDQTEFLEKLKDQIDSLSDGAKQGQHVKTVVSIDSFLVNGSECEATKKVANKTKKAAAKEEEQEEETASDNEDDEDTIEAKKAEQQALEEAKRASQEAAAAKAKEQAAKAKAAEEERLAKEKAAKEAAQAAANAKREEQAAKLKAKKEKEAAAKKAAEEEADAKRKAQEEKDAIKRREAEQEAAAKKKAAEEEAAAEELKAKEIAEAVRKAKEEEAAAKKAAEEEAAAATKKAVEEAAAAEAAEAKRREQEALEEAKRAKEAKDAAKKKNPTKPKAPKTKKTEKKEENGSDDEEEQKMMKPKKSGIRIKNITNTTNSTKSAEGESGSDEESEEKKKKEEEEEEEEEENTTAAKNSTIPAKPKKVPTKATESDDEDETVKKDPKKAKEDEEAAKKTLEEDEEEAAEKAAIENKKTKKETKAEKKAKAAKEAAEQAEQDAKEKQKKAEDGNDKEAIEEAKKAEQEAKEKRLLADAAQLKAEKAAAAAKRAHSESAQCKLKAAKDAKAEDAAEQALKDAMKAKKVADDATDKAKEAREKAEGSEDDSKKEEASTDDEDEKKRKEAEAAQAKADAEAAAIKARKEQIRRQLAEEEAKAREEAERAKKEAEEKAKLAAAEAERMAQEAAEKARQDAEEEARKAKEEAERIAKQNQVEAEEKRKAKLAAEEEARKAEKEAQEKAERAIRAANEAKKKAAEEQAKKEAAYRAERVNFLDKLPSQVMKGSDKRFANNEQFSIVQFNNNKVNLMRGKYTFRARTFQDAFERFGDLIKPIIMKDTDAEFGLIGNKQLLATTSIFNDNLKDQKVNATGEKYVSDEISMMMLGLGLRENIMEWPQGVLLEGKEYQMIFYDKKSKNATIKAMGSNYQRAKKLFDVEMKKGNYGVLIDWNHNWKHWSADYNLALQAVSRYFFTKGYYLGVVYNEEMAGFEMEWQVQQKIDAKLKLISGQFNGDGSVFAQQQYFYIWKWSNGKVSFEKRASFWKMGDAYTWYITYVSNYLRRDHTAELLLIGSNTPLLSTAAWSSDINKIIMGRAMAEGTISIKQVFAGQSQQYYMILMNRKSREISFKGIGNAQAAAYKTFGDKCSGSKAQYWGILFHSDGKIHKIVGDSSNKLYKGDYWGYWFMTEYFQTRMSMWTTWVRDESGANIVLKKEEDAKRAAMDAWKRDFASRIWHYGGDLIDNFNGTGYKFAKNERFYGVRFNTKTGQMNYWSFYATNMDRAYETFGKNIKQWATRNYKNTAYDPEEYYLFGNNRMLLSSLSTTEVENNGMNMTNAVIGWTYDKNLYIPDDGLLNPDGYKNYWMLLQDRASNKTEFRKCDMSYDKCSKEFDKATALDVVKPTIGFRGVLIKGIKDSVKKWSANEEIAFNSTAWSFKMHLYSLVGEFMANNNEGDFDSYYVPDESTAGFEIKAPYYKGQRLFHSMVNILQGEKRYYQVHGWWNTYYLKGPVTYYADKNKWWKSQYGNKENSDMVQVLVADVDKYSSKVVMVFKPGQLLNDSRMFLNFGELARIKGYAPNNCSYKVGKGENIKMVLRDKKTNEIRYSDTKTTDWNSAKTVAKNAWKESTGEIWLIYTDQKVYNIYKDDQNPLNYLTVLGQWIFESCPDYQHVHPTDEELGFPTIYEH